MVSVVIKNINEMDALGFKLGTLVKEGMVITLSGDLAAGKTTFSKSVGLGLGVKEIINSPTYTIVKVYDGRLPLYHFDAYRLEDQEIDLGFEEMIYGQGLSIIEWPQFIEEILPKERLEIKIDIVDAHRVFHFNPIGQNYILLCKELCL